VCWFWVHVRCKNEEEVIDFIVSFERRKKREKWKEACLDGLVANSSRGREGGFGTKVGGRQKTGEMDRDS
jgi:hypothetical protein